MEKEEECKIQATYIFKGKTEISEIPRDFNSLKETIQKLYKLTSEQINHCQITYKDKDADKNDKIIYIMDDKSFQEAKLISEQIVFSIELEEDKPIKEKNVEIIKKPAIYNLIRKPEIPEFPKDFISLKETIKKLYKLTSEQIDNCQITYKNKYNKTIYILDEEDFQKVKLISDQIVFSIELEEDKHIQKVKKNKSSKNQKEIFKNENNITENYEDTFNINFLPNINNLNANNLPYIQDTKDIYVNLFKIFINKPLKIYQYPFSVSPELEPGDYKIRKKIFKYCGITEKEKTKKINDFYGFYFISGDSLYSFNEVKNPMNFNCKIFDEGLIEYNINIQPKANERTINQKDVEKDPLTKQFIELLIQDILHSNPNLEFYKGLFVVKTEKILIDGKLGTVVLYPGYTTSFMETESGNYLNVNLKNKLILKKTILEIIKENKDKDEIRNILIGQKFHTNYSKKNYIIDDILFDRNPTNTTILYEKNTITLVNYYKIKYDLPIKDIKQPLLVTRIYDNEVNEKKCLYFIPELCYLSELSKEFFQDRNFMKKLADYTKLNVNDRIKKTNDFLKLLIDPNKIDNKKLSALEKSKLYGIEVKPIDTLTKSYYMEKTTILDNKKKPINLKDKVFDVVSKKDMTNWLCLYNKSNYNDAEYFYESLLKASKGFGLKISEPEWVEMSNKDKSKDWIDTVEDYLKNNKYSFVVFLLDRNDYIYKDIKIHSLCKIGYISQVVKVSSLKKNSLSVCSKILLQINSKLSGVSYLPKLNDEIKDRNLMIIGVDSSHLKGKGTGVAMVATINKSFTNFYNKEIIINEEKKEQLCFCINGFIMEALNKYKKLNGNLPKGIIIYRQGVSLQQKVFLKSEVYNIEDVCKKYNLLYYYILVNTKTTYKFFEQNKDSFNNPSEGLLVINGVTNRKFFEFYIQPQLVTQGCATPTCFHVAFGNMDFPEMIPKLTFDLCHLYSNWQGPIRVPHVLKAAEKLSKMTVEFTKDELHNNLKIGQAYL